MNRNDASPNLRERQAAATRDEILDVGMKILARDANLSQRSIAAEAGIAARTVYRHFPDRAQLLKGLWERMRDQTNTRFPANIEDIAPLVRTAFQSFDENDTLVRAVLFSGNGTEVRDRGGIEGKAAFAQSLQDLLQGLRLADRSRIIAVFLAIYSAPFWQLLRDRGGLDAKESQEAGAWAMEVLLDALRGMKKKRMRSQRISKQ